MLPHEDGCSFSVCRGGINRPEPHTITHARTTASLSIICRTDVACWVCFFEPNFATVSLVFQASCHDRTRRCFACCSPPPNATKPAGTREPSCCRGTQAGCLLRGQARTPFAPPPRKQKETMKVRRGFDVDGMTRFMIPVGTVCRELFFLLCPSLLSTNVWVFLEKSIGWRGERRGGLTCCLPH